MKSKNKSIWHSLGESIHDLCYFLTALFCALRACDVITWKWYCVISPLLALEFIGIFALIIAGAAAISIVEKQYNAKENI